MLLFGVGNALWAFSLFAVAFLVLFAGGVRAILREHDGDDLFTIAAFGGALLLVAAGIGAETLNMTGAWRADEGQLTPELGRALFEVSYVLGYNAAGVGIVLAPSILLLAAASVQLLRTTVPGD